MKQYLKASLVFALTQMKRSSRDPMTLLVLCAIPILLLVLFGAFLRNSDNISIPVAIVNNSNEQFAKDFNTSLSKVDVLQLPDEQLTLEEAKTQMREDKIDGIVELLPGFGTANEKGVPSGTVKVYYDAAEPQEGDILASVMRGVVDEANKGLADIKMPLDIAREPINITKVTAIDAIFAMFTGLAVMMIGLFGVASVIPYDKKGGYLRRLRATPLRPGQFILGTMINYAVIGLAVIALMTVLAITIFDMNMRGNWFVYGTFVTAAVVMMLGMGLAVGSIAKNTTQADVLGQVVFLASMALGGIWFPRAMLPEFLQGIVSFMPLTPVIDGIRAITVENASLMSLGPEFAVLGGWALIAYIAGVKLFRWD